MYDKTKGLFTVNGVKFPLNYISEKSYKFTPNSRTDLNSGLNNANGRLVRKVLPHTRSKLEFETRKLDSNEFLDVIKHLGILDNLERKVTLECFNLETMNYDTDEFYLPDYTPQIDTINEETGELKIDKCRFAFIEY